jgi:hypothetical protein
MVIRPCNITIVLIVLAWTPVKVFISKNDSAVGGPSSSEFDKISNGPITNFECSNLLNQLTA